MTKKKRGHEVVDKVLVTEVKQGFLCRVGIVGSELWRNAVTCAVGEGLREGDASQPTMSQGGNVL